MSRPCRDIALFRSKDLLRTRTRSHPLLWSRKLHQLDRLCQKLELKVGFEPTMFFLLSYKDSAVDHLATSALKVYGVFF